MPFGLKNAPRTFQRTMDEFLRGVGEQCCQIYVDDIIVFSPSEEAHKEHLRKVLDRARDFGVKLAEEKCLIAQNEVTFLGHVVSAEGVKPDPEKVKAILEMKLPTTPKGVRSLLGVLNYYRRFVPQMAHKTAPLTNMLRKGAKVVWTAEAEQGVRECIRALTGAPVLGFPDFEKEFVVTSDASAYALGAVLSQSEEKGDRPVAYVSRRLTPAEERYSAIERELLGVVWAIETFRPYVYGRRFTVVTDHKPLQWVSRLKESSARVGRWKERLAPYQFVIRHMPGKDNVVADWLSRAIEACPVDGNPTPGTSLRDYFQGWQDDEEEAQEAELDRSREEGREMEQVDEVINGKSRQIIWKTQVAGLDNIQFRREGKRRILEVRTTAAVTIPGIVRILKGVVRAGKTSHLYVGNEVVWTKLAEAYKNGQLGEGCTLVRCLRHVTTVRDPTKQREIVSDYHVGKTNHRGSREMLEALRRRYYWDSMKTTVEEEVRKCEACCRVKAATRPPEGLQEVTATAKRPLQWLEADTFVWRGHSWVTMVDVFSKLALVKLVRQRAADVVLEALREWCTHYGTPEKITTDGGTEFRNAQVEAEAKRLEIQWHVNTPGHTRGRGCVERLHATLSDHLRLIMTEREEEVPEAMVRAVIAYNHSIHTVTGYSPIELVFGGAFGRRDGERTGPSGELGEDVRAHVMQLRRGWREARERIIEEKARRVLRHNVKTRDAAAKLAIGTVVYRRIATNRRKEPARYAGPYKVIAIREHNLYTLESVANPGRRRQAHITQLKIPVPEGQ